MSAKGTTVTTAILPSPAQGGMSATRRWLSTAYTVVVIGLAAVIGLTQLPHAGMQAAHQPELWLVAALALLAGTQAFISAVPGGEPVVICPTICFTFAILLCWGLGPAIIAQLLAVVVVAWKLKLPFMDAAMSGAQYALAFTA